MKAIATNEIIKEAQPPNDRYCNKCNPQRPYDNVLSPLEVLRQVCKYNFCPMCGRRIVTKHNQQQA